MNRGHRCIVYAVFVADPKAYKPAEKGVQIKVLVIVELANFMFSHQ
jgi:hypothetical protein